VANEFYAARAWVWDMLSTDSDRNNPDSLESLFLPFVPSAEQSSFTIGSRVHQGSAPNDAIFPLILIRRVPLRSGKSRIRMMGMRHIATRMRFQVVAVINKRSYKSISSIVSRIDAVLDRQSGPAIEGSMHSFISDDPYDRGYFDETVNQFFSESGFEYEATILPA
jgi:hypothetical protein